jgi:hypothetical protein
MEVTIFEWVAVILMILLAVGGAVASGFVGLAVIKWAYGVLFA